MNHPSIVVDPGAVLRARCQHASFSLLSRIIPSRSLRDLEFEWRYRRYLAEFGESDSDVYISTYSKSGTTWTQVILYQLTTPGEMDFDHLFDVSPWIWYSALRRVPPSKTPAPRLLKSHDDYRRFVRGRRGRVIFVVRDGRDVCVSLYHHRKNFKGFTGSFDEHFADFLHGTEYNWFDHLRPWLTNEAGLPILYVRFEDLKGQFDAEVRRIAQFLGFEIDDETLGRVRRLCSFPSMKQHEYRLGPRDDHFIGVSSTPYHVKNPNQFIRRGVVGEGVSVLSSAQLEAYRRRFDQSLGDFPLLREYK